MHDVHLQLVSSHLSCSKSIRIYQCDSTCNMCLFFVLFFLCIKNTNMFLNVSHLKEFPVANGIQWDPMGSNGIQWDPMGSDGCCFQKVRYHPSNAAVPTGPWAFVKGEAQHRQTAEQTHSRRTLAGDRNDLPGRQHSAVEE